MSKRFLYKIKIICSVCVIILISFCNDATAQQITIVNQYKNYCRQVKEDSLQKMILLQAVIPDIVLDLRYATENNFTHKKLYKKNAKAFMRITAARALEKVQATMLLKGLGLKFFDAYRPFQVTQQMWNLIHDERYVADPAKGT